MIEAEDLFELARRQTRHAKEEPDSRSLSEHLERSERAFLLAALQAHNGAITEAATRLGISRKTLWEKMRRHGIEKQRARESEDELLS